MHGSINVRLDYAKTSTDIREKSDLSQMALAELLSFLCTSVNRWKNGKYTSTKLLKVELLQMFKTNNIEVKEVNE